MCRTQRKDSTSRSMSCSDGARNHEAPGFVAKTVVVRGHVAGNVVSWKRDGKRAVGYWIGREYWDKGVASRALAEFLRIVTERPLHAHVAKQNLASLRVLEKCGFTIVGEAKVPFGAPGEEIAEYLMTLT